MRRRNVKNAKGRIENHPELVVLNYKDYKGKWKSFFGNDNPIYLEIGMGKGKFLLEHAKTYPNINFIGLEKFDSVIVQAVEKIYPLELNNIKNLVIRYFEFNCYFFHPYSPPGFVGFLAFMRVCEQKNKTFLAT